MTGSDSARVAELIESDFTAAGAGQDVIVFDSDTLTIECRLSGGRRPRGGERAGRAGGRRGSRSQRPITAAALIMAAVFGCFLVADVLELKELGFALAAAVVLDASFVRLLVVPAIMKVAGGSANWWLPRFLDRILPRIRLD